MARYTIFGLLYMIWIYSLRVHADCPIAECTCLDKSLPSDERIIDCRDRGLFGVPSITASDEIFREITFSSTNPSCREDTPSTCSNKIIHIQNNAFAGLKVRKIDFNTNYLSTVEVGAFNGLEPYLTELILEGDDVNLVPFASLKNLTNLVLLELERFKHEGLTILPQEFPHLETLVLHTLQMEFISPDAVSGKLRKLKRLEILDNPKFNSFPLGTIRLLTTLEHIRFVQNEMQVFPNVGEAFISHTKLTELDLSHNAIHTLQSGCFNHIQNRLKYLGLHINSLDGTKLTTVANGNWPQLEQLILDSNPLQTTGIPDNLFQNMPNLANLNLQQTQLVHIEKNDFKGLTNLHFLHLSGNEITQIDKGTFTNTPNLKELYLDYVGKANDKLNFSVDTAQGLENLIHIDLKGSHFETKEFWNSMSIMTGLKQLILKNTGLADIPNLTFQYNTNLQTLELDENSLNELTQAQVHGLGRNLTSLSLHDNNISLIDKCVVEELQNLNNLFLQNNPLHCDCKLLELYDWVQQREIADPNFGYLFLGKCASPPHLQDQYLIHLTRGKLVCTDNTPIECQTFTTSTPSTTTITTSQSPLPVITQFTIDGRNENGVQLSWVVQNTDNLFKYNITKHKLGGVGSKVGTLIGPGNLQYFLFLEETHADYEVCIKAITTDGRNTVPECKNSFGKYVSTLTPPTASPPAELSSGVTAAIGIGSAVIVILIVVMIIFLLRYKTKPKYKDTPPVHFTAVPRPQCGYDSKRFSKPKKSQQANGDIIISAITSGKTGPPSSPDSRHSAGSYQYLNENQMIDIQPHLNYAKGAHGISHTNPSGYQNNPKQQEVQGQYPNIKPNEDSRETSSRSRYDRAHSQNHHKGMAPKQPHQYVNDPQKSPHSVYTNDIKDRPLPKPRNKHYENNNSSGFLNHGFDSDSPTDHTYHEIGPETEI